MARYRRIAPRVYTIDKAAKPAPPVGPAAPSEPPAPTDGPVNLDSMLKAELVTLAEERGVDASGTKAEIIERLLR